MSETRIEVQIRPTMKPGKVKAFADIRLYLPDGEMLIHGFAVIQPDGKSPWVGFPQTPGRNKFFPVVEAKGRLSRLITTTILDAYRDSDWI